MFHKSICTLYQLTMLPSFRRPLLTLLVLFLLVVVVVVVLSVGNQHGWHFVVALALNSSTCAVVE